MAKTTASALLWALAAARGSALIAPSPKTSQTHSTKTAPAHKARLPPLQMGDWAEANAAKALDAQKRIVMKFGGSSIRDAERVTHVADLIASKIREGFTPAVVVSAMGSTTNELERAGALALVDGIVRVDEMRKLHLEVLDELELPANVGYEVRQLLRELESLLDGVSMVRELTPRTKDLLVSFGERMSCRIVAGQLKEAHDITAVPIEAWNIGLRTEGGHGEARVDEECYDDIARALRSSIVERNEVPVITGYVGHDADGRVTTLGRGGSDLTATTLARAGASETQEPLFAEVQVWKDVDGLMSADPKVVSNSVNVPFATYEEAAELAYFGASILHPTALRPAQVGQCPVRIKNSYNPDHPGTLIASPSKIDEERSLKSLERPALTAITAKRGVTLVDISSSRMLGQPGFLAAIFEVFERDGVSVDVVATSEVSVSLTLDPKAHLGDEAKRFLSPKGLKRLEDIARVDVRDGRAIVSFIADVARSTELIARVFTVLAQRGVKVEMLSQGASKVNISLVVLDADADEALKIIHDEFFSSKKEAVASR